jgi:hypothetical protein
MYKYILDIQIYTGQSGHYRTSVVILVVLQNYHSRVTVGNLASWRSQAAPRGHLVHTRKLGQEGHMTPQCNIALEPLFQQQQ